MRDIYLIDFENVASEGLSGITYLSEDDQVIIFYSNNSNRISMKMHILIGKSVCKLDYFEILVGGKNALDHQLSTWLGYLIGTGAAERNYYIVSRDMGYRHVANFWAGSALAPSIRCIDSIKVAGKLERQKLQREAAEQQEDQKEDQKEEPATEPAAVAEPESETAELPAEVAAEAPVENAQEPAPESEAPPTEVAEETEGAAEVVSVMAEDGQTEPEHQEERIRSFHNRNRTKKTTTRTRQRSGSSQKGEAKQENQEKKSEPRQGLEQLSAMLLPYPTLQENHLRQLIHENKKQILCNTLRKQLGQEKGLALYNDIKKIAWR